jgi:hypothetical protein
MNFNTNTQTYTALQHSAVLLDLDPYYNLPRCKLRVLPYPYEKKKRGKGGHNFPGFKRRPSDFGVLSSENTPT